MLLLRFSCAVPPFAFGCAHTTVFFLACLQQCVDTISGSRAFSVKQDVPADSSQGTPGSSLGSSEMDRKSRVPSPERAARTSPPPRPGPSPPGQRPPTSGCLVSGRPRMQCQPQTAQLCLQLCVLTQITQPLCASLATSREWERAQHLLPGVIVRVQDI